MEIFKSHLNHIIVEKATAARESIIVSLTNLAVDNNDYNSMTQVASAVELASSKPDLISQKAAAAAVDFASKSAAALANTSSSKISFLLLNEIGSSVLGTLGNSLKSSEIYTRPESDPKEDSSAVSLASSAPPNDNVKSKILSKEDIDMLKEQSRKSDEIVFNIGSVVLDKKVAGKFYLISYL